MLLNLMQLFAEYIMPVPNNDQPHLEIKHKSHSDLAFSKFNAVYGTLTLHNDEAIISLPVSQCNPVNPSAHSQL